MLHAADAAPSPSAPCPSHGWGSARAAPGVHGRPRPEATRTLLRRVVEALIDFIDTARHHGEDGLSERLIADALHRYPPGLANRDEGGIVRAGSTDGLSTCARRSRQPRATAGSSESTSTSSTSDPSTRSRSRRCSAELREEGKIRDRCLERDVGLLTARPHVRADRGRAEPLQPRRARVESVLRASANGVIYAGFRSLIRARVRRLPRGSGAPG